MNTAKALHGKNRRGGGGGMSLAAAARQLGLDPSELGESAENFWQMLNDMAENNPEEYKTYIDEQMKEAKRVEEQTKRRGFRPKAGFVVRTAFLQSNKKVFLNFCSFDKVDVPQDASGNPIDVNHSAKTNLSGLSIPLAIGKPRSTKDEDTGSNAFAVDVVFHPWVISQSREYSTFQTDIIELAIRWCEQELELGSMSRQYRILTIMYKEYEETQPHGEVQEAFFTVEGPREEQEKQQEGRMDKRPNDNNNLDDFLNNPTQLLATLREKECEDQQQNQQARPVMDLKMPEIRMPGMTSEKQQEGGNNKKKLIEEIAPPPAETKQVAAVVTPNTETSKAKKKTAVKKGFLNNNKNTNLYGPEGSREGAPTSIYQKSKIVDLSQMSQEEARAVMEAHATGGPATAPAAPKAPPPVGQGTMDLMQDALKTLDTMKAQEKEDLFAKIAEEVDSELGMKNIASGNSKVGDNEDPIFKLFGEMAKTIAPLKSEPAQEQTETVIEEKKGTNEKREFATFSIKNDESKNQVTLSIDIPKIQSLSQVDVEISSRKVVFIPSQHYEYQQIKFPVPINEDSARAKFNKKQGKLVIKATPVK